MNKSSISDIKVLGKDDILIVKFAGDLPASKEEMDYVQEYLSRARETKQDILISGMDVYIMRDGAKMLLKDELTEIKEAEEA